jgi:AraC-like DNA-binding protein
MNSASERPEFPGAADELGEVLSSLQTTGVFYTRSYFSEPWGLDLPPMPDCVMFHAVTHGRCRLRVQDAAERLLEPGDLVVVPHGDGHLLMGSQDTAPTRLVDTTRQHVNHRYEILTLEGGGEPCRMVCGAVQFEQPAVAHLVRLLPRQLTINGADPRIRGVLDLMRVEAEANRPGSEVTIARLADVLVIAAISAWVDRYPDARGGWLAALRDPEIGRALLMIRRQPAEAWSVQQLADAVYMSRSAFAKRFADTVGQTPVAYVRRWKMHLASTWLSEEGVTVAQAAQRLGYESEASFSRAFKRETGRRPGGRVIAKAEG